LNEKITTCGYHWITWVAFVLFGAVIGHAQAAPDCVPLDAATRMRALQLVARKMGTEPGLPRIDREALLPGTCYWQLFVTLPHRKGNTVLSISPDRRFVSPALWDLSMNLEEEDAKLDTKLRAEADADHSPVRGPESAPVTVILFSDFQCPYCGDFNRTVEQYQKENPGKVRLVCRNKPLP
jgi:Thioredoxin